MTSPRDFQKKKELATVQRCRSNDLTLHLSVADSHSMYRSASCLWSATPSSSSSASLPYAEAPQPKGTLLSDIVSSSSILLYRPCLNRGVPQWSNMRHVRIICGSKTDSSMVSHHRFLRVTHNALPFTLPSHKEYQEHHTGNILWVLLYNIQCINTFIQVFLPFSEILPRLVFFFAEELSICETSSDQIQISDQAEFCPLITLVPLNILA